MPNWKKLIVSGSDAHLTSLDISGALTASSAYLTSASIGHLQTIYETASVIYSSGSTKFGDTFDDTHEITGSVEVSGSIKAHSFNISSEAAGIPSIYSDSNINLSASNAVVITSSPLRLASFSNAQTSSITAQVGDIIYNSDTATYDLYSGSWLTILNETSTASYSSFASSGDGVFTGSFSGSFIGDASNLTINPFPFTGSGQIQGQLVVESFNDYIDDYVESYFAGTAIVSNGDIALTGSILGAYQNANSFTGSFLNNAGYVVLTEVSTSLDFTNDTDAGNAGVPLGGLYRNGNAIQIRIS